MNISHSQISPNFYRVCLGDKWFYFSYETLIGLKTPDLTLICKNQWSKTTGKHINYLKTSYTRHQEVEKEYLDQVVKNETF